MRRCASRSRPVVLRHPAVWWPYQMGASRSTTWRSTRRSDGAVSDSAAEDFGIRTVRSRLTPVRPGTYGRHGYRQFAINGRPFVVRGGGWSQDMFLRYSPASIADQLAYVKDLGLNAIRFEGNLPPEDMFEQMDRAGILALPGWQCCSRWEQDSARWTPALRANARNQAAHVAALLRDHPSVLAFYQGSDNEPDPAKEALYLAAFRAADWPLPQIASAEYKSVGATRPVGLEGGPVQLGAARVLVGVGHGDGRRRRLHERRRRVRVRHRGERRAASIPTQDSLDRFLSPRGPAPAVGHELGRRGALRPGDLPHEPLQRVHGDRQARPAQHGALAPLRPLVGARLVRARGAGRRLRGDPRAVRGDDRPAHDRANPSTGLIYWQLNKAWPSLQWQLYGYDLDQAGVYFGAKKANERVHILYAYSDGSIRVSNLTNARQAGLRVRAVFFSLDGSASRGAQVAVPRLAAQGIETVLRPGGAGGHVADLLPRARADARRRRRQPQRLLALAQARRRGLGGDARPGHRCRGRARRLRRPDGAPAPRPPASVDVRRDDDARRRRRRDGGAASATSGRRPVPAFFLRADVRGGAARRRRQVLPIRWSDNDQTIWPGEELTLTARYRRADLRGGRRSSRSPAGTCARAGRRRAERRADVARAGCGAMPRPARSWSRDGAVRLAAQAAGEVLRLALDAHRLIAVQRPAASLAAPSRRCARSGRRRRSRTRPSAPMRDECQQFHACLRWDVRRVPCSPIMPPNAQWQTGGP